MRVYNKGCDHVPSCPFFGRPHLQVLVYWLRELTTDTATRHAVHVSIEPCDSGRLHCVDGAHSCLLILKLIVILKRTNSLYLLF